MWLLRLPALACVAPQLARARASISLVPVLPTLPVMAMKWAALRSRARPARVRRPSKVSTTSSSGAPLGRALGWRLTIAAAASRSKAACTKSWPSWLAPASATKRSPASTLRLSMETPVALQESGARPPVADAASAEVQSGTVRQGRLMPPIRPRSRSWRSERHRHRRTRWCARPRPARAHGPCRR